MCQGCDERDDHDNWRRENRVENVGLYLIRNTQQRAADDGSLLWWGEGDEPGWSSWLNQASVYADTEGTELPPGGEWVEFGAEVETLKDAVPSPLPEYAGLVNRSVLTITLNEGRLREHTVTEVEKDTEPLYVEVVDHRGQMARYGPAKVMTYLSVSGTDVEGVRARFTELAST